MTDTRAPHPENALINRIRNYLAVGGFINPESMEHNKVRDLLIDCGEALQRAIPDRPVPASSREAADPKSDYEALYFDLLFQVAFVHKGESRHETAKRYIRQSEESHGPAMSKNAVDPQDRKTHV